MRSNRTPCRPIGISGARPARHRPGRHAAPEPVRTAHLIDLENLVGGHVGTGAAAAVWADYTQTVPVAAEDHVTIAVAGSHAGNAAFGLPRPVRWLWPERGPDAADSVGSCSRELYLACPFQHYLASSKAVFSGAAAAA